MNMNCSSRQIWLKRQIHVDERYTEIKDTDLTGEH